MDRKEQGMSMITKIRDYINNKVAVAGLIIVVFILLDDKDPLDTLDALNSLAIKYLEGKAKSNNLLA
jgi:hypothetical protein